MHEIYTSTVSSSVTRLLQDFNAIADDIRDDEQAVKAFGEEVVTRLCERLLAMGAPGLHFYTMNQSGPILRVLDNLGL